MRSIKSLILSSLMLVALSAVCRPPDNWKTLPPAPQTNPNQVSFRDNCNQATQQTDLAINNVRARLLNGGDLWWDFSKGKYVVPKVQAGQPEVSSLYAGAVWIGGVDPAGNLKMACQTYRSASKNDFWPGPLSPTDGTVGQSTCKQWDKFFRVLGANIRKHKANYEFHKLRGEPYPPDEIPKDVKGWPARGNEYFQEIHGFDLPNTNQGLGLFYDNNGNTEYNPEDGDFPVIDIRGCEPVQYPDEMVFWIYNDNGNIHTQSGASPIQMEVQVQAFGYSTQDELNDMTFYRFKLINRAIERIDSCFFAMWVDPDLGCSEDDYVGCDTVFVKTDTCEYEDANGNIVTKYIPRRRDLMYVYNQDQTDGVTGCVCPVASGNTPTYCNEVPILGVDYFRGPLDENGCELGMSSFVYWVASSTNSAQEDPGVAGEFYNYLTGRWKDGTPFTAGGSGYNLTSTNYTKFAFGSPPNDANGWSMCAAVQPKADQRTLQASGPFRLDPGLTNELIVGVPWVPNIQYPCPDLEPLLYADRLAQGLFDNCFDILDGPDAPDLDWVELNREVVCVLSNDISSNNYKENYTEKDFLAPTNIPVSDREFKFEGYKVYQLASPNTSVSEVDNVDKARIVFQCDVKNNIKKIFNWEPTENPFGDPIWAPVEQINGSNSGVAHSFDIKEDQFGSGNSRSLVNHKKYYYLAVAYGYNNFGNFDPATRLGQRRAYLEGRLNVQIYTVIPRPIVDRALQANYGDGPEITRLEGVGVGSLSVELKEGEHERILSPDFNGELTYELGKGPLNIRIYDPLNVRDGEFELTIVDDNLSDTILDANARWILKDVVTNETVESERSLARLNEQLIANYGFSVSIAQTLDAGHLQDNKNGGIEQSVTFTDPTDQWLDAISNSPDALPNTGGAVPFLFCATQPLQSYNNLDPKQGLSNFGIAWFVPYLLTHNPNPATPFDLIISPRWSPQNESFSKNTNQYTTLKDLNNVDIVFTKDKSKWSRCIVVETASNNYTGTGATSLAYITESDTLTQPANARWVRKSLDTRYRPSVGKEDADGDGLPDPDGEIEPAQMPNINGVLQTNVLANKPVRGMGWFPGYAVDVETGERLNIFFGENSIYNGIADGGVVWPNLFGVMGEPKNGADMMFNPSSYTANQGASAYDPYLFVLGGQHFIYVTRTKYDGCERLRYHMEPDRWTSSKKYTEKIKPLPFVTWTAMMLLNQGSTMKSYADGLIPNDCTVRLRVDNPYGYKKTNTNGYPRYRFKIAGKASAALDAIATANSLDSIKMVPNPYYGYSNYETSQFTNVVKISNLPAKCTVTIYSLDGKFIRQYNRDEVPQVDNDRSGEPVPNRQILPDIEWDMKNTKAVPVASGVYLIHIDAPGLGQRTLKWFGIGREFDPSGL